MSGKTAEHIPSYTIYFMYRVSQDKNTEKNMKTQNKRFENITCYILFFATRFLNPKFSTPQKSYFGEKKIV